MACHKYPHNIVWYVCGIQNAIVQGPPNQSCGQKIAHWHYMLIESFSLFVVFKYSALLSDHVSLLPNIHFNTRLTLHSRGSFSFDFIFGVCSDHGWSSHILGVFGAMLWIVQVVVAHIHLWGQCSSVALLGTHLLLSVAEGRIRDHHNCLYGYTRCHLLIWSTCVRDYSRLRGFHLQLCDL